MEKICMLFSFVVFCSCGGKMVEYNATYNFEMVNGSGHIVQLEMEDLYGYIPPKLVLEPGVVFQWGYSGMGVGFSSMLPRDGIIKITFDDTYTVVYTMDILDRNPFWEQNYVITEKKRDVFQCVYTFTEQDYLNAVEQSGSGL